MKVIYISHSKNIQGAANALINIVDGIRKFGCEPIVIVPGKGDLLDRLMLLGIKTYIINCEQIVYPSLYSIKDFALWPIRVFFTIFISLIAFFKLKRIVKIEKPDIIHSNTGIIRYGAQVAKRYGIPHVWHIREYQTRDFNWKPIGGERMLKDLFSQSNNHCIAISKGVFEYFNLTDKDIQIYDGVFHDNIKLPSRKIGFDYFLYVGSISYGKGILDALDAFNKVASIHKDCKFLIAGRGGVDIEKEISKSFYADRIQYLGQRRDIFELMSGALALLVPSYYEGFGFITVEAMLNKCIVIGRDTAGTKEQFDNGKKLSGLEIGLRFNTKAELADRMLSILDDNNSHFFDIMRNNAWNVVNELYPIEKNVKSIYKYYCSLL